jgi:glutathione reductase (NADPH)
MSEFDYDLFVIGGGSGGVRAARMAAQYGAKVVVAEEYLVGGTCVVRGCIPKKLFVYASHFSEECEIAKGFGWDVPKPTFSWPKLLANKDREIDRLNKVYIRNLEAAGAEIIQDRAELRGTNEIYLVDQDRTVTAAKILIATGATPFVPHNIPGAAFGITSNEAFHLEDLPKRIVVVGGGYIAVEFAGIFHGLGVETCLLYRGPQILRGFDDDLRNGLAEAMINRGINVRTEANVGEIEKIGDEYKVCMHDGSEIMTDLVMYATGRVPNTTGLGLENAGIDLDGTGAVKVDQYSQTNVENIHAVGDVTNRINLTPVAIREGAAFAETVYNDNPVAVDHADIASAVFSQPELGTVGLTEDQAREQYGEIEVFKSEFRPMKLTLTDIQEKMMMKLIVDKASDRVLGCHIMGPDAGEIVQVVGITMKMNATKADFDRTIALHPSAAEELVTMR